MTEHERDPWIDGTEEEREALGCRECLWGCRCAYRLGHGGPHWTITEWGECSWTEALEAARRAAFDDTVKALEKLAPCLDVIGDTYGAEEVRRVLEELLEGFPMYAPKS